MKAEIPDAYLATYDGFGEKWISTSMLACLQMCGVACQHKYIDRWHESVNVACGCGVASHDARAVNLEQKIKSEEDLSLDEVKDAARDAAKRYMSENEIVEEGDYAGKSKEHLTAICVDRSVALTAEDYRSFQIDLRPKLVEEPLGVRYAELDRVIVGKLDVMDIFDSIKDYKTSARPKGQSFADTDPGLTTYGLMAKVSEGITPTQYEIQNVICSKGGTRTQVYETTRTDREIQQQLNRFIRGIETINAGIFLPCNPTHWKCSRAFCGFYDRCEFGGN